MTRSIAFRADADAASRNQRLLIQLRWIAIGGQLTAILAVHFGFGIALPLKPMLVTLGLLLGLNLFALFRRGRATTNLQMFGALLVDVGALTVQLYLSGGSTNPFVTLYLLQVVIGAVLLSAWSSWALVAMTSVAFAALAVVHRPLPLPAALASDLSPAFMTANWFNFTLTSILLVAFVTRMARNVRDRDAHLAAIRQRAAEEDHIVRMGLLASGAAHELGTPLASLSVALGDWRQEPAIAESPRLAAEVDEMRDEIARCKKILGGVLFAAGEVTGEAPVRTSLRRFLEGVVADWRGKGPVPLRFESHLGPDRPIVADRALAQALTNLFDNAAEAGAGSITLAAVMDGPILVLAVRDDGRGFREDMLGTVGQPYRSSKEAGGLGLFLATNVLRTLGGTLEAQNRPGGGAEVVLALPIASLALEDTE
ncbi:ATP-binding protein [Sphingomonas desiccabilis]|uniref:histidine kinase n=1 Tax=Sphingomonas desiccabilis TaxID=429134 RepID=A0A4Q2J011_9SPHN|nr:ATP-binding protein [Sphingomonas desiccabilis]MBB3910484.1 two-component system sensor histidine kinase RegB [Sphingomonas desiccabilis]RXZ35128.1 HAMP domain-containing histidine kinase [Sphingomonas desiccabilis]